MREFPVSFCDQARPGSLLCLVSDRTWHSEKALLETLDAVLEAGANLLQFREKEGSGLSDLQRFEFGKKCLARARAHGVPFIVNDRLDLAMALNADGVHLGQNDLPIERARELWGPKKTYGVSISTSAEARIAVQRGASYLGIGAMFPTRTKGDAVFATIETLGIIVKESPVPVIAIGGINLSNMSSVLRSGCAGVAIVSAILATPDPAAATKEIRAIMLREQTLAGS